uniref:Uncharacterized protein n=1 Tax=Peronospora matthiolae TaxID=2874970 RepID=A0AAV1TAL5_9STRA
MSRCDVVLDDGGAGIPGTLGIIEVGWSAGASLNQEFPWSADAAVMITGEWIPKCSASHVVEGEYALFSTPEVRPMIGYV